MNRVHKRSNEQECEDAYVESMTKIHTTAAEKPGICAVNGLKKIMLSKDLSKLAYSMLDESYRWMR